MEEGQCPALWKTLRGALSHGASPSPAFLRLWPSGAARPAWSDASLLSSLQDSKRFGGNIRQAMVDIAALMDVQPRRMAR